MLSVSTETKATATVVPIEDSGDDGYYTVDVQGQFRYGSAKADGTRGE